jgi:hypothetical protein
MLSRSTILSTLACLGGRINTLYSLHKRSIEVRDKARILRRSLLAMLFCLHESDEKRNHFGKLVAALPDHYVFPHSDRLRIAQQRIDYVVWNKSCLKRMGLPAMCS